MSTSETLSSSQPPSPENDDDHDKKRLEWLTASHQQQMLDKDFADADQTERAIVELCAQRSCRRCAPLWILACPHLSAADDDGKGKKLVDKVELARALTEEVVGELLEDRRVDRARIVELEARLDEEAKAAHTRGKQAGVKMMAATTTTGTGKDDLGMLLQTAHAMARLYGYDVGRHGALWQWVQLLGEGKEVLKKAQEKQTKAAKAMPPEPKEVADALTHEMERNGEYEPTRTLTPDG